MGQQLRLLRIETIYEFACLLLLSTINYYFYAVISFDVLVRSRHNPFPYVLAVLVVEAWVPAQVNGQ